MEQVRVAVIGVGGMGSFHASYLRDGKIGGACLSAVCDLDASRLEAFPSVPRYSEATALLRDRAADAVLIATPHYDHTKIGILALKAGLHVLVEKPISVHKADCEKLIAAYDARPKQEQVFSAMFNQRTLARFRKIKQLVQNGEIGDIIRVNWICTDWFRSQCYYDSGGWRATWKGEGGGVLLNQCPHNLDLIQWLCGMPTKVRAFCHLGKWHRIEVEDDVTAYLEYPNGATGVFITSTGDAPGTNRLEITGDRGKLILEKGHLSFVRTEVSVKEYLTTTSERFATPPVWQVEIPLSDRSDQHQAITQNFVNAILNGEPLIAPATEGIHSVELGNAMLLSSLMGKTVELPMNAKGFARELRRLIQKSPSVKKAKTSSKAVDLSGSFLGAASKL